MATIGLLVFVGGCGRSPDSAGGVDQSDGEILVEISATSTHGSLSVLVSLYPADANIHNPTSEVLEAREIVLDPAGNGSTVFTSDVVDGDSFQVGGIVNRSGGGGQEPEDGDLLFRKTSEKSGGGANVSVVKSDFEQYSTITGIGNGENNEADAGGLQVGIWEGSDRTEHTSLGWVGDVEFIVFEYRGEGGAIGSVGRHAETTPGWPVRVDDTDSTPLDIKADIDHTGAGTYYFAVYGWVLGSPDWDTAAYRHEFYVIEATNEPESDPFMGTLTVDGIVYNMHRHVMEDGATKSYRFKAIRTSDQRLSGPVNMAPFFSYWRSNGMQNGYITALEWAIELLEPELAGTFYGEDIVIPTYLP